MSKPYTRKRVLFEVLVEVALGLLLFALITWVW